MSSGTICVVCNHTNPPGATKCLECSAPLRVSETIHLSDHSTHEIVHRAAALENIELGTIALYFIGKTEPLLVTVKNEVVLGRHAGDDAPNVVDLTEYRAGLLGVSRRHAVIRATEAGYIVEDLNSTNGTWVKEIQLSPETPFTLENGDSIRLGELIMYAYFKLA